VSLWSRIKAAWTGEIVTKDDLTKALSTHEEERRQKRIPAPVTRTESLYANLTDPGGRGPRKQRGYSTEFLRMWARQSPYLRAVLDIRKREVSSADWDIVPNLDDEQQELEWLEKLVHGAHKFPDMDYKLDLFTPIHIDREMVRHLIQSTRSRAVTTAETGYRFSLALQELREIARRHAAPIKRLLENPDPVFSWADIRAAIVPDVLTIDAGCIEKIRNQYPTDPRYPNRSISSPQNRIVGLSWVDGATIRPCFDEYGRPRDILDPPGFAYEQWIQNDKIPDADFRRCDLIRILENPQTDITWRGYGFSRVETLVLTCMLDAMSDKADMEEYQREWYHGLINIKDKSFQMEDAQSLRQHIMENWEGNRGVPVTAFSEVEYLSMAPGGNTRDNRSQQRRDLYLNRICAIFEIGKTKLGVYDQANYSTSENSTEMTDDGLDHFLDVFDRHVTEQIVWDEGFGGHRDVKYVSKPAHQREEMRKLERMEKEAKLGLLDVNDMRLACGKAPIDEGNRSIFFFESLEKEAGRTQGQQMGAGAGVEGANAMNTDADEQEAPADLGGFDAPEEEGAPEEDEIEKAHRLPPYNGWPPLYGEKD
jgi:hypothetical protein